eukprot:scaffold115404_cov67-Phaeocystis_antarctica.AAC.1
MLRRLGRRGGDDGPAAAAGARAGLRRAARCALRSYGLAQQRYRRCARHLLDQLRRGACGGTTRAERVRGDRLLALDCLGPPLVRARAAGPVPRHRHGLLRLAGGAALFGGEPARARVHDRAHGWRQPDTAAGDQPRHRCRGDDVGARPQPHIRQPGRRLCPGRGLLRGRACASGGRRARHGQRAWQQGDV